MSSTSTLSLAPGTAPVAAAPRSRRAVRTWLFVMAALVIAMVAVGGATRLTGSGLSITEWKPVTGAIPPLSGQAWAEEFASTRRRRNTNCSTRADPVRVPVHLRLEWATGCSAG